MNCMQWKEESLKPPGHPPGQVLVPRAAGVMAAEGSHLSSSRGSCIYRQSYKGPDPSINLGPSRRASLALERSRGIG